MSRPGDSGMLRQWQGVPKVSGLDAGIVKLPPAEDVFNKAAFCLRVSEALVKMATSCRATLSYHLYALAAVEMLVRDVRSWYEEGV